MFAQLRVLAWMILLSLAAGVGLLVAPASASTTSSSAPCGSMAGTTPHITHVIWIWEENHDYTQIIGSSSAPYINALSRECGLASNYRSISHPSAPNYVGAVSGLPLKSLPAIDCTTGCRQAGPSLFAQTDWRAYQETMPKNCDPYNSGLYAARHNPAIYFKTLTSCGTDDVPYSRLSNALGAGTLASFTFITPNLADDMHDGTISQGDAWLAAQLPKILNSSDYTSGHTAIFITWDEGSGGGAFKGTNCITSTSPSCHVPTIVLSPYTPRGTVDSVRLSHYSLLRTAEELLALPLLGQAATATSMRQAFHL